jgi:sensor domain CHASE-containing protein
MKSVEGLYNEVRDRVIVELRDNMSTMTTTEDGWTSDATQSYLGHTGHYLTAAFEPRSVILGVEPMPESHTAANITAKSNEGFSRHHIEHSQVYACTHDRAAAQTAG